MSLFVHVGYAKAASTLLQERVFPEIDGVNYLGKRRGDYPDWLLRWHYADDLEFERAAPALRDRLEELRAGDRPALLSSEIFTMHGGHTAAQARRLRAIAPDASVLIVVRDPIDRMLSFYRHLVERDGLHSALEDCLEWRRTPHVFYKRKPVYLADSRYDEWIDDYRRRFGGRVCVLRYEDLAARPEVFFGEMERFLGVAVDRHRLREATRIKENEGAPVATVPRRRFENALAVLRPHAGGAVVQSVAEARPPAADDVPLLDPELRGRLERYYRGVCAGYY